jgi:hypothetical protein
MFERDTVFILGAGASNHFGYPLGTKLRAEIIECAEKLSSECPSLRKSPDIPDFVKARLSRKTFGFDDALHDEWNKIQKESEDLASALRGAGDSTIDHFLHTRPRFQQLGRMFIAQRIIQSEENAFPNRKKGLNAKYSDANWVGRIAEEMTKRATRLSDNRVNFVTFNYDLSLERLLFSALETVEIFSTEEIQKFLRGRVIHMYGGLPDPFSEYEFWDSPPAETAQQQYADLLRKAFHASTRLSLIDPDEKNENTHEHDTAKSYIQNAERIFILGYGFARENNERLGFPSSVYSGHTEKEVFFTNHKNSRAVNTEVGNTFHQGLDAIAERNVYRHLRDNVHCRFTKSEGDVLTALRQDFLLT